MGLVKIGAEKQSFCPLAGSKETSTSLLTKLVPGQVGLSQQLNSKAACLIVRPAVRAATKPVSSGYQSCKQNLPGQGKHRCAADIAWHVLSYRILEAQASALLQHCHDACTFTPA